METVFYRNLKLYNLVPLGHSERKIEKIVHSYPGIKRKVIQDNEVLSILGTTPTNIALVNDIPVIKKDSFISIWCLNYFGINSASIKKLESEFKSINELAIKIKNYKRIGIHEETASKIMAAIKELRILLPENIENSILAIIKENEPISNINLKTKLYEIYPTVDNNIYEQVIDNLELNKTVINTIDGLKIKRNYIKEYISASDIPNDKIVYERCNGATLDACGQMINVSRERARQIIEKRIEKYPLFENELELTDIYQNYSLSENDITILGLDIFLWRYISFKNEKNKAQRDFIDYIKDFDLSTSKEGLELFTSHNVVIIENEIVKAEFIPLLIKFLYKSHENSIVLLEKKEKFNNFLDELSIEKKDLFISEDRIKELNRKLENSHYFLNCGEQRYFLFERDNLSTDFIEAIREYLQDFEGYGSVSYFWEKNKELCTENKVFDDAELFILMKTMFSEEFNSKIEFIRNPTLMVKGVDKSQYIEGLLFDVDLPCTVEKFLDYIHDVTGLRKNTTYASFSNIFAKYKNNEGLLSLDVKTSFSEEDRIELIKSLNERNCIGLAKLEHELRFMKKNLVNSSLLRQLGYLKTNTTVYKDIFSSRYEAIVTQLQKMNLILNSSEINAITNIEYFRGKFYEIGGKTLLLKIGDNKYLNLVARDEVEIILNAKKLILSKCSSAEIYNLDFFINSQVLKIILNQDIGLKTIAYSFDTREVFKSIILKTEGFYTIVNGTTMLFSKFPLSYDIIIKKVLDEYKIISLPDLREELYEQYGIEKYFSNTDLSNMGFYCPYTSEKIYLDKKYYEQEMEELLNESFGS